MRRPRRRPTITLSAETFQALDAVRGNATRQACLAQLIAREKRRLDREAFIALANSQCTESYRREVLKLNAELPIHGEV